MRAGTWVGLFRSHIAVADQAGSCVWRFYSFLNLIVKSQPKSW